MRRVGKKLQLHVLNAHTGTQRRGWEETVGGDGHAYGLDRGDGFAGAY